ncbi:MAG: hypothetical protein K8S99_12610 [Planctomycetes bacterium]|nr:hypothetical protein [Planctomycetota bacterium]
MAENAKLIVCPYCGHVQPAEDRCEECRGLFEPLSRRATQIAMGPWYVRDKMSPFRPGCSYEVLRKQITSGRVKPMSVIRGPTTHQFWAVAKNVPGVAHLLGYCHKCGNHVSPEDRACPTCSESFKEPIHRDELGLIYPTATESGAAQKALERELSLLQGTPPAQVTPGTTSAGWLPPKPTGTAESGDLLDQVLSNAASKAGSTFLPPDPAALKPPKKPSTKKHPPQKKEAPPTANVAQAVDFTPSEEGQIDTPTSHRMSPLMLGLLIGNGVVVVLLVLLVVYLTQHHAATP